MLMSYDQITIVINTFYSEDKIHNCLNSIDNNTKVIVVENSDNIKFKNELQNKYSNVECILTGQNLGYAKGNNLGLSKVKSKYALILNPDAKLDNNALENFLISANNFSNFAIIGPAKQDEYSSDDNNKNKDQVFQVDTLKGFAMFLNLDQFKEIGFFDENFLFILRKLIYVNGYKIKIKKYIWIKK